MKSDHNTFVALKEKIFRYFFIVGLFSSIPVHSSEIHNQIIEGLGPNSITIIGEYHKKPESIKFFQELIYSYFQQDKCLVVALEIASHQQPILDELVEGRATVSDIEIPPMIDHPPFRAMIVGLARLKRNGNCLKLLAIDAELGLGVDRDVWMASKLVDQVSQIPILALLGNLHTLKKVDWNISTSEVSPYVAEILTYQGRKIRTYPQIWLDETCNARNRFISSKEQETVRLINRRLITLLNASDYETLSSVIDGVVLWECG